MKNHRVPVEYLDSAALAQALQSAHVAKTHEAIEAVIATAKERLYLIGKDGPLDPLREETTAPVPPGSPAPPCVCASGNLV